MTSSYLPTVTIDFLEESASGMRSASLFRSPIKCLIASRSALPAKNAQTRSLLDVPGVYLLFGPPAMANDGSQDSRLYIGQADRVADRLDQHLVNRDKQWWRTVVVIRQPDDNPMDLSQCKFVESELYKLAREVERVGGCVLMNRSSPPHPIMPEKKERDTKNLMDNALVILSGLGLNLFDMESNIAQSSEPLVETTGAGLDEIERKLREGKVVSVENLPLTNPAPEVSAGMQPVVEEVRRTVTSLPNVEWYWTAVPDYRAKVISGQYSRLFLRILLAQNWVWVNLRDGAKFQLQTLQDIDNYRKEISTAYHEAEEYLQSN